MTQRWFLLIHGQVKEVSPETYLLEAKRADWPGITTTGPEPTWEDFIDRLVKALEEVG